MPRAAASLPPADIRRISAQPDAFAGKIRALLFVWYRICDVVYKMSIPAHSVNEAVYIMRVLIPFFGSRVAPNILFSENALVVQLYSTEIVSRKIVSTAGFIESDWLQLIEDYDVNAVICGGIDSRFMEEVGGQDVQVVNNTAGEIEEVLGHFGRGNLKPGYGISYRIEDDELRYAEDRKQPAPVEPPVENGRPDEELGEKAPDDINCIECIDKTCLEGENCQLCPLEAVTGRTDETIRRISDVAYDVASEPERVLCRVSELVYFCLGMQYKHIGIAFCTEMWKEAERVTQILERFFHVTPVCCRIGGTKKDARTDHVHSKHEGCNPVGMARTLNLVKPDLNIAIGLCVGSDIIFNRKCDAPVTTLFVKDKLLAHNPVGAVYSKYALEHLEEEF